MKVGLFLIIKSINGLCSNFEPMKYNFDTTILVRENLQPMHKQKMLLLKIRGKHKR